MDLSGIKNVLIIDDKYEESLPIIQALAMEGIFTIYWNGQLDTKPEQPFDSIRLVILDMRFSSATDSRSINAFLFTLLKCSISNKNGPYILCIWSKHDNEYLKNFKCELGEHSEIPQPYLIINLEKNNFIRVINRENEIYREISCALDIAGEEKIRKEVLNIVESSGISETEVKVELIDDAVQKLKKHLEEKLKDITSLSVLLIWENIVNSASNSLVNSIAGLSTLNENWDNNIKTLIQQLAVANIGNGVEPSVRQYVINALSTLNQMLPDELWNQLHKQSIDEEKFEFIKSPAIMETIGNDTYSLCKPGKTFVIKRNNSDFDTFKKISEKSGVNNEVIRSRLYNQYMNLRGISNYKLLCESSLPGVMKKPGSVYKVRDMGLLEELSKVIYEDFEERHLSDGNLVKIDISSSCDYAQKKIRKIRTLPGILVRDIDFNNVKKTEDTYVTPELKVKDTIIKIAFHFQYIGSEPVLDLSDENMLFSFREMFLVELKHKLSSYISRVGIINL